MKRIGVLVLSLILAVSLGIGGTIAWFSYSDSVDNIVTMGNVKIGISESVFDEVTQGTKAVGNVVPGANIEKDPAITNTGSNDALVRIELVTNLSEFEAEEDIDDMMINFNTADWAKDGNSYFYKKVLKPGETTTPLFSGIGIPTSWVREQCVYQNDAGEDVSRTLTITVNAFAVQADNYTPAANEAPWKAIFAPQPE